MTFGEASTSAVLNTLYALLSEGGDLTLVSIANYSHQPLDTVAAIVSALGTTMASTGETEFEPFRAVLAPTLPQTTGQPSDVQARLTAPSSANGTSTGTTPHREQPPSPLGGCGGVCRLTVGAVVFAAVMGLIYRLTRA